MRKIFYISFIVLVNSTVFSQLFQYTSYYVYNPMIVNPAETAADEKLSVHFYHRQQWVGFEGAPNTQYLSVQNHFHKQNMSLGLSITNDHIASFSQQDIILNYSYRIPTKHFDVYLGLSGGMLVSSNDFKDFVLDQYDDQYFGGGDRFLTPNAGTGLYLQGERYFFGLSLPQLINNKGQAQNNNDFLDVNTQNLYFRGGYLFTLEKDKHELIPNLAFRMLENGQNEIDVNIKYRYMKQIEGMLSFHSLNSMGIALNYLWNEQLSAGYMLDFAVNGLMGHQGGTHQLMLAYKIPTEKNIRVVNPRDF